MGTISTHEGTKIDDCDKWYYSDIKELPEATRRLFEEYSGISPESVIPYVQEMRSRAFAIYPYPCIGQLRFLNLSLSRHPLYQQVLSRLRVDLEVPTTIESHRLSVSGRSSSIKGQPQRPPKLLDLGCCLAQDLRKLVFDGVPSENLYGLDIEARFIDLSYDFFRDIDTLKSQFVVEDMFGTDEAEYHLRDESNSANHHGPRASPPTKIPLAALTGQMSIIAANSFFHLYSLRDQLMLAKRVVRLLSPEPGSFILGRQVGSTAPGEYTSVDNKGTRYAHDVDSFRRFWDKVASEVGDGCQFRVEATLDEEELGENKNQGQNWSEPNIRRLIFAVWRV